MILILDAGTSAQRALTIMRSIHRQVDDCKKNLSFISNRLDPTWIDGNIKNQNIEKVESYWTYVKTNGKTDYNKLMCSSWNLSEELSENNKICFIKLWDNLDEQNSNLRTYLLILESMSHGK